MKIWSKTSSYNMDGEERENLMRIPRIIGPLIDKACGEIFAAYWMKLINEPITYIVPAVWGAKQGGELSEVQKEIHQQIVPTIKEVFEALDLKNLSITQEFAVGFLVRGFIISKITYMIEALKYRLGTLKDSQGDLKHILDRIKPLGTA